MQLLRNARHITRFVLVWFALSLGVAIASPLVKPQGMQLICSAAGTVKIIATADGAGDTGKAGQSTTLASHTLDCPLCAGVAAPPPPLAMPAVSSQAVGYALPVLAAQPLAQLAGAPLPARGPPALA